MAPTARAPYGDLHAAMGFLDAFAADDPVDAAAASASRDVTPMTDQEIDELHRHTEAFVRSPRGQALIDEIRTDLAQLADFAEREGLGACARELRSYGDRLPDDHMPAMFWQELLTGGRHDLAAVAQGISDARVPLEERRTLLVDLSKGLTHCGVRIRVEIQQARQVMSGYQGELPQAVRRMFEKQVEAVIHRIVGEREGEDPHRDALDVHRLIDIQRALALVPSDGMTPPRRGARFAEMVNACREALAVEVTPNALAMALAADGLASITADLRALAGDALDLAENRAHLDRLHQRVTDLSTRYGPLRAASFMELDEDALPRLVRDPTLIALDIRRGMTHHGLAQPAPIEEVLVLGQGDARLAIHAADGQFCHVLLGDPALQERHPLRPEHLHRVITEQPPQWHAQAPDTAQWPPALRRALLMSNLATLGRADLNRVSPNWLDDAETARHLGARMDDDHFADYLTHTVRTELSDTGLKALMHLATDRPHPSAALRHMVEAAPDLAARMWSSFGAPWLQTALVCRRFCQAQNLLFLLARGLPDLPPDTRRTALAFPDLSTDTSLNGLMVMQTYLALLATSAERGWLPREDIDALLAQSALPRMMGAQFSVSGLPPLLLPPLGRLCRLGLVSPERLIALVTYPSLRGGQVPMVLSSLRDPGSRALPAYMDWVLEQVGQGIAPESVPTLLVPRQPPDWMSSDLRHVCATDEPSGLIDYLRGLVRAHQAGWLPPQDVTGLLHVQINQGDGHFLPLLAHSLQGLGQTTALALLDWLTEAVAVDAIGGDELLRLLGESDGTGWPLLGMLIAADLQVPVRACAGLLAKALARGVIGPDAMSQLIGAAVNERQSAAVSTRPSRDPAGMMGIRLRRPGHRPQQHALDVLWESLLPSIAQGHWRATRVGHLLTGRHGAHAGTTAAPKAILMGAYERLVKALLERRTAARSAALLHPASTDAAPARDRSMPSDELIMTLLISRNGPQATPVLSVAAQGGAQERVSQLMAIGLQQLREHRLTRSELALWWGATDDDGRPALHTAIRSRDPATLTVYLNHLLEAIRLPSPGAEDIDLRTGQDAPSTSAPAGLDTTRGRGAAAGGTDPLVALLSARSSDGITPAHEAVGQGDTELLHAYLDAIWTAHEHGHLSDREIVECLDTETSPRASSPLAPDRAQARADCQKLLQQHRELALGLVAWPE